jgi:excisionase family DNA binding protein
MNELLSIANRPLAAPRTAPDEDEYFSIPETARIMRVSPGTVSVWLTQGRMRRTKAGHRTLVRRSEINRFLVDGGKSLPPPRKKAVPAPDAAIEVLTETSEPEPDKPAAPEAPPPRRLYRARQKPMPAQTA